MKKYLIDTNIAIFYMKGRFELHKRFDKLTRDDCFISEITLAELKFGVANSVQIQKNQKALEYFLEEVQILPIFPALDLYASEKARLRKLGKVVDDFDLLIGATAAKHGLVLLTNNIKHFQNIEYLVIEDWTK
jgi:tRNA(fMet)-specific endonuclease VapC